MNSPAQEFQSVISLEKYAELAQHPKKEVRKWVGERLKDLDKAETFPILQTLMNDTSDEISIFAMNHLAEKQATMAAPLILERFQAAEKELPAKSVLASWCAQALGKLNYAPALADFANYLKQHPTDVGILGIASALGDLHQPEARQILLNLLKSLESSKDGGIPFLGDVAIDALLKHHYPEDIPTVFRLHLIWQNAGHKNPRTLTALAKSVGDNQIFNRLDVQVIRDKANWNEAINEEAALLELSLSELLETKLYGSLTAALGAEQPAAVMQFVLRAAEKILAERYGSLETLRNGQAWETAQLRHSLTPPLLQDQLSLAILEELANPRYKLHHSKQDALTDKKQALLAVSGLLEIAARKDFPALLAEQSSLTDVLELLTLKRFYIPAEFADKARELGLSSETGADALIKYLSSGETTYAKARAIGLLGRIGHLPAIPQIVQELTSDQDWLRLESILALTRIGLPFLAYLEDHFTEIPLEAWEGIAEVLAHLPVEESAEIAYLAWLQPQIPKSDALYMVQERIGSLHSIERLAEIYETNPQLAGTSLELMCEIHDFTDLPILAEVREANRLEAEEMTAYQQEMWQEFNRKQDEEKERIEAERVKQLLAGDKPVKPTPITKTAKDKIERNDPCPCGSGKKYKKCCGK